MGNHVKVENVRISYPSLFRPRTSPTFPTAEPKYEATFLVDAQSAPNIVPDITAAIAEAATAAGFTAGSYRTPPWETLPDGTVKIATRSQSPVYVADEFNNPQNETNCKVYAGCRVHAVISVYAYTQNGNGVTFGLEGVQFAADDARLDNKPDASALFTPLTTAVPAVAPAAAAPV